LADAVTNEFADVKIEFIKGSGGVFDVTKNGNLIYSKHQKGRFPEEQEIINILK
jgi:selenoprotein W-related protein